MSDKVIATVNEGKVKGIKKISNFSGVEYYSFLGIPYAQPPVGQSRFKDPVKVKPWKNGILDGTVEKGGCRQFCFFRKELSGSEDCLYNNIYTPKLPSKDEPLKPVIVSVHPGGYLFGSPDPDNFGSPDFLMHQDVVYICVGFRMHILGFLNLGLKECSGNQALKDVLLSLQWIKENVKSFGGDPDNITLLGSSSGAALIHCLMLSPKSEGLFHKAVLMGLYISNPTIVLVKETITQVFQYAKSLGYEGDPTDRKKMLTFFKTIDIDTVITLKPDSQLHEMNAPIYPTAIFVPTFEQGENSVLPLSIKELVPSTIRVPLIIGFCDKEAAMGFTHKYKNTMKKNFYTTIRQNPWGWGHNLSNEELKQIKKEIETFYFNGDSVDKASLSTKCDVQTDICLSDLYDSVINILAADLPTSVFVYKFDFESNFSTMKEKILSMVDEPLEGTVHGSDYNYFAFMRQYVSGGKYIIAPRSHNMIELFTKLITTFARKGNPNYEGLNVEWKPSTVENPCYLSINDSLQLIEGKLNGERMEFWQSLKKKITSTND